MMVPAKGWPAFRIVTGDTPRLVQPDAPEARGALRAWRALSDLLRRPQGQAEVRGLADIPDEEVESLSEAGRQMRRDARLAQAALERKRRMALHVP